MKLSENSRELNKDGSVFGSKEYPVISAPIESKIYASQDPLKPV